MTKLHTFCRFCKAVVLVFVGSVFVGYAQSGNLLTGSREIKQGDKGFIAWRFAEYETVQIAGDTLRAIRTARDMLTIQPAKTTVYKLTALGKGKPRLDTLWRVVVLTEAEADSLARLEANSSFASVPQEVSRGAAQPLAANGIPESVYLVAEASNQPSTLYAGIIRNAESTIAPARIKIMRIPDNSVESASIHAVVLDRMGNFLPTFSAKQERFSVTLFGAVDSSDVSLSKEIQLRNASSLTSEAQFMMREASLYDSPHLAVTVCLDKAAYMKRFEGLDTITQDFMRSLGNRVEQQTITFDHRITLVGNQAQKLGSQAQKLDNQAQQPSERPQIQNPSGGLTALYKAAYKGLLTLKQSGRRHKALILISGGKDDASILYTMQDVMRSAKDFQVVVYAIAVGSNADTYTLRQIADFTGGRFYAVDNAHRENVSAVLREIALSYKAFYEVIFTSGTSVQAHSKAIDATLAFKTPDNRTLSETKPFALSEKNFYSTHQIVATFAANSFQPDSEYDQQISSLAQALRDNPDKVIELVGHTDMQGNDGINRSFALRRAQAVKTRLVNLGVQPAQIRLRSVGREKPVYYFESEEWQSRVNRRVELRWLDPSLVPYEILAEAVASEEEAMRLEAQWNARGYDAYYDAFLINRIPAYRLKLWGFPSLESAEKTKQQLQSLYKISLKVQ